MQARQRHWRPDPFYFQDQETFNGRPTGKKKHKYEHITKSMVNKLRDVTRARRRIWDAEARKWDMRFPIKDASFEKQEGFGAAAHIREIQRSLVPPLVPTRPRRRQEYDDDDDQDYHQDNADNEDDDCFRPAQDLQEGLLIPQPTLDSFEWPEHINNACIVIQKYVRGRNEYRNVRSSLTYKQLLTWSKLHRSTVNRTESDKKQRKREKCALGLSKLQAVFRGWRGRGKAKFVKHRVWSAASRVLQ
jgi:hypothetical protein